MITRFTEHSWELIHEQYRMDLGWEIDYDFFSLLAIVLNEL